MHRAAFLVVLPAEGGSMEKGQPSGVTSRSLPGRCGADFFGFGFGI